MADSLKKTALKGTVWSTIERFSVQGVTFVVMIIMARLLDPTDYGLVGMLTIFIAISQALVDSGFSQALIRKQKRTQTDNSTVFYFNIAVGLILYLILFFAAPAIARFYSQPLLVPLTRVIGLSVLINSFVVVQRALFTVQIDFKTQAKASMSAALVSGAVGIYMAYTGFGVWSIAAQQIVNLLVNVSLLWVMSSWRPSWAYSWKSFREFFSFGSRLAASSILDCIYNNLYLIVIGKAFNASDLGYYTRANQFASFPSSNLTGILQRVTFPVLCKIQNDDQHLRDIYIKFLRIAAFVIFPLMISLAAIAKPLVLVLLNQKWEFAAVLLQILCLSMMWFPIHAINLNLLQVKGRSDLFLRLEVIKKGVGVAILCATIPFGLIVMCWGLVLYSLLALIINTHFTGKLINVGFFRQMGDIFPILLYSLVMGAAEWGVSLLIPGNLLKVVVGMTVGVLTYLLLAKLTKSKDLQELLTLLKRNK